MGGDAVYSWLVGLRWMALAGVAVVLVLAGSLLGGLPEESTVGLWAAAGALLAYNAALAALGPRRGRAWIGRFAVQIVVDCLALAALVHLAGGIENPFLPLFVLHVITAGIVLGRNAALLLLAFAVALVAVVLFGEGSGLLAHHCLREGGGACAARRVDVWTLAVFGGLTLTFVSGSLFTRSLTGKLREGQRRLAAAVNDLRAEKERLAETRAAIDRERSKLQAIIDCMGDAVVFADPDGQVLLRNGSAVALPWSSGAEPELWGAFAEIRDGSVEHARRTFERDGRSIEATCSVVRMESGESLGLVMVARDVTEQVAMKKHLMHEERMSVVGKLAAAVAHEINNPIGVVSLYSQHALAKLPADSDLRKHLETIRRNADSCRKITGDLLTLARPRRPDQRPVDLRELCRDVARSVEPVAERSGVRVSDGKRDGRAALWAPGDADQLRQALLNLALNAIEAVGEGGTVSVDAYEAEVRDAGPRTRVIEVRDTGPGIEADVLEKMFQPFFTTKTAGTGLGLSVADNIVRSHAGRIEVESAAGAGTAFRIVLPDPSTGSGAGPMNEGA